MLYLVHMAVVVVFNLEAAFKVQRGWYLNDVLGLSRYDEGDAARPEGYVDGDGRVDEDVVILIHRGTVLHVRVDWRQYMP